MGVTRITIKCPTTWQQRCCWVYDNCVKYEDLTNWGMWQVGLDDIYIEVEDADAVMYYLIWD